MSNIRLSIVLGGLAALMPSLAGCPQYRDPTVPNPIRKLNDPESRKDYLIYEPSAYDPAKPCPLVVACHGTWPFDHAWRQIRDWVGLAEEKGFIVIAPYLEGTRANLLQSAEKQIELQRDDEETILSVIRHVCGGHSVSQDRIFLTGWSAGNFAVMYTGLRHPDVFRALAVLQGNFNPVYLTDVANRIDPHQPVFVLYGSTDVLTGKQGPAAVEWLRDHGATVYEEIASGAHMGHPKRACEFFERVVRTMPWLHIRAAQSTENPLEVQFNIRASFEPEAYSWSFGDGETSPVAAPKHLYATEGTYAVSLDAKTARGNPIHRTVEVTVGRP